MLAELAARQHGVVAARQLRELGFTRPSIQRRTDAGRLHRLHRGVYAAGHTKLSVRARWMAAVLACGLDVVLSHAAAVALRGLRTVPSGPIDVSAPGPHKVHGVRCHVTRSLPEQDRTRIDAIPVTSLERTLLDQAENLRSQRLRSLLEAAQQRDLLDVRSLNALIARSPGRRGVKPLAEALAQLTDEPPWTQSELERRFLELVRDAGLPEPQANVLVAGELVDFSWAAQRLVVEVDGYRFHKTRSSFEADRRRDAGLQIVGRRVVRITARRIEHDSRGLIADLRRLLIGSAAA